MKNDALKIIDAALKAADPYKNTFNALKAKKYSNKVTVISVGKAACPMAKAAYDALGDYICQGFVLTKYGHSVSLPGIFTVMEAGHPVPDENSVKYTKEILDAAEKLTSDEKIIFLLSGGGSALFEQPAVSLEKLKFMTDVMLRNGADIKEINALRKILSLVKGGKFASRCKCKIDCFILSDVIGDDPCTIASGPCCGSKDDLENGLGVLTKYFPDETELKEKIEQSHSDIYTSDVLIDIVGNVQSLCKGAADEAASSGYDPIIVTTQMIGDTHDVVKKIIDDSIKFACRPHKPTVFIYGGETTVTVKGNGTGGRNQEAALTAAIMLHGMNNIAFFAFGSDGTDGPTDAAGGFADGETYSKMLNYKIDPQKFLDNNDSYHALKTCGNLIITGPTGTNVNDIFAVMIK